MEVDFGTYSQHEAQGFLSDKVNLSQNIAKRFLDNSSNNFPNDSVNRLDFEILVEGFLVFMIAARDGLLQEINKKLSNPLNERRVNLRGNDFENRLTSDSDSKFGQIWNLIHDSIQQPEKVVLTQNIEFWEWDRSKSWLWEINDLRNRTAHRSILSQNIAVVVGGSTNTKLLVAELTIKPVIRHNQISHEVPISNPKKETIFESDPKSYFKDCYNKFEKLKTDIRNLL